MKAERQAWVREFAGAITVCDAEGVILEMNDESARVFAREGGFELVGKNLLDCHPEPARSKLEALMRERRTNVYTIEKNGVKRLVYQSPWTKDGQYAGFVEISVAVPSTLPHFIRS